MSHSEEEEYEARGHREDMPLSISQLNWFIKQTLEHAVPRVWVEGEVTDLTRPSSGHIYFSLKDDRSQIRGVIWRSTAQRLPFELSNGQSVICCGGVEVYPPRGSYQLIVNQVMPQGLGSLQLAFQQLHDKLKSEGLFDDRLKKPLPKFPKRVGFITSPTGAALHDFVQAANAIWNDFELTVLPARVQGEFASRDIVAALRQAHRIRPNFDVLVVGRGGGSMEDLWCFNEEKVVRAVSATKIPIVSAIGHEIDVTLTDLVSDARALTPTQAASVVLPNRNELSERLTQVQQRLQTHFHSRAKYLRSQLETYAERSILANPHALHVQRRQTIDELELRARHAMAKQIKDGKERVVSLARAIEALSPLQVLTRGYSLTTKLDQKAPIRSIDELSEGDTIRTRLNEGIVVSKVDALIDE